MATNKLYLLFLFSIIACSGTKTNSDEQFLNRPTQNSGGRSTMQILPPSGSADFSYKAVGIDTVHIRQSPLNSESKKAAVELLVKGYLSDGCSELHEAKQTLTGNQISVEIMARKPSATICTMAIRPFRFYLLLNDALSVGAYTIRINEQNQAFIVK
jgi:hypothetical protein